VASLYAFVQNVSRACTPPPQSVSYSESSSKFFEYISHLADCTKQHILGFDSHADDDAEGFIEARTELLTLRNAWRELHQFIKPSADADTLNQPTAMVAALVDRLHELPGFESTDFTIFHTDSFYYAQVNPSAMEVVVTPLARIVDAHPFPTNLGLIGIPNSQGNAMFLNCLLAHEIGEYAYAKRGTEAHLEMAAAAALEEHMGATFSTKGVTVQSRLTKTVLKFAKEIFCDLFAVRLIGHCYSFAYIELFDLPNLLGKDGALAVGDSVEPQILSYPDYPSHPFRVKVQSDLLKAEGWWDLIKDMDSRHGTLLRVLLDLDLQDFVKAEEAAGGNRAPFVKALIDVMPRVKEQVGNITNGIDSRLYEYGLLWKPIAEYLRNGIVPSTLNILDPASTPTEVHPTPITALNAAYRFYLEGVEALMSRIKDQNVSSAQDRAAWMKRIESWTTKALEDVALFRGTES